MLISCRNVMWLNKTIPDTYEVKTCWLEFVIWNTTFISFPIRLAINLVPFGIQTQTQYKSIVPYDWKFNTFLHNSRLRYPFFPRPCVNHIKSFGRCRKTKLPKGRKSWKPSDLNELTNSWIKLLFFHQNENKSEDPFFKFNHNAQNSIVNWPLNLVKERNQLLIPF